MLIYAWISIVITVLYFILIVAVFLWLGEAGLNAVKKFLAF
jgi:hypothetical protein